MNLHSNWSGDRPRIVAAVGFLLLLGLLLFTCQDEASGTQVEKKIEIPRKMEMPADRDWTPQRVGPSAAVPTIPWSHQFKRRKASGEQIAQWLKELGDNKFHVRESAVQALLEVGEPALKGLQEAKG